VAHSLTSTARAHMAGTVMVVPCRDGVGYGLGWGVKHNEA